MLPTQEQTAGTITRGTIHPNDCELDRVINYDEQRHCELFQICQMEPNEEQFQSFIHVMQSFAKPEQFAYLTRFNTAQGFTDKGGTYDLTCIGMLIQKGNVRALKHIVDRNDNIFRKTVAKEKQDTQVQYPPLLWASRCGDIIVFEWLLFDVGLNPNQHSTKWGNTCLFITSKFGPKTAFLDLLNDRRVALGTTNAYAALPLHFACTNACEGTSSVFPLCLLLHKYSELRRSSYIYVNGQTLSGQTPLNFIIRDVGSGKKSTKLLLMRSFGADLSLFDKWGKVALDYLTERDEKQRRVLEGYSESVGECVREITKELSQSILNLSSENHALKEENQRLSELNREQNRLLCSNAARIAEMEEELMYSNRRAADVIHKAFEDWRGELSRFSQWKDQNCTFNDGPKQENIQSFFSTLYDWRRSYEAKLEATAREISESIAQLSSVKVMFDNIKEDVEEEFEFFRDEFEGNWREWTTRELALWCANVDYPKFVDYSRDLLRCFTEKRLSGVDLETIEADPTALLDISFALEDCIPNRIERRRLCDLIAQLVQGDGCASYVGIVQTPTAGGGVCG